MLDRCDALRGLACRRAGGGRFVCQQKTEEQDKKAGRFCTPRNALSKCAPRNGVPQECRAGPKDDFRNGPIFRFFFSCQERQLPVRPGGLCEGNSVRCTMGGVCGAVAGIVPETKYCRKVVKNGGSCTDRFSTVCKPGLACRNGRCTNGSGDVMDGARLVGRFGACSETSPCARGLECGAQSGGRVCLPRVQLVGAGKACWESENLRRRCVEGLVCRVGDDGRGVRKCREKVSEGDICDGNEVCKEGLRCSSGRRDLGMRRTCKNERMALKLGDACEKGKEGRTCGEVERRAEGMIELGCLQSGSGFKCLVPKLLYERCGEESEGCVEGTRCKQGVCLPQL